MNQGLTGAGEDFSLFRLLFSVHRKGPEQVSEDQMVILARDLAKKIEEEMEYPGQIKVHVLRETKVIEYAK